MNCSILNVLIEVLNSRFSCNIDPYDNQRPFYVRTLKVMRETDSESRYYVVIYPSVVNYTDDRFEMEFKLERIDSDNLVFLVGQYGVKDKFVGKFNGYIEDPKFIDNFIDSYSEYLVRLSGLGFTMEKV